MKGLVFTEFFEFVDDVFSIETSERLIEMSNLQSGAIYTSIGTYDIKELITLLSNLSALTGITVPDLLRDFGRRLFGRFAITFPGFFTGIESTMEFLPRVHGYVHMEVRKLYPDAELPTFSCSFPKPGTMVMTYRSPRNLADMAEGLILGCIEYFGDPIRVKREISPEDPLETRFILMKE